MKIKFAQKFKSINEFDEQNIKDFSVFLGVNGSGKTHLLKALQAGSVLANQISNESISYFNLQTFSIKNQASIAPRNIDDEKLQAWNILNHENHKNTLKNYDDRVKTIIGDDEYPYSASVPEEKKAEYSQIKKEVLNFIDQQTQNNAKVKKLLKTGIFESNKYISDITQADFFKFANYDPDDYELLESLSEVFLDYHRKLEAAKLPSKNGGEELSDDEVNKRQELSPWHFVNRMFREFGLLHSISNPKFTAADYMHSHAVSFQVKLFIDDEEIDFDDLSSGEKILCALAITVYQDSKSKFPELLLLDEVDASLHPSMIQNLLDVINNVFIKNNCKVILATHSPTTTALVPEESLFEIQKGKEQQKIRKISQSDAIELLSEGIITFEKGLKIQKEVDTSKTLQIITEGNNAEHIQKALEILDNTLLNQVKIIKDGSAQKLKNAFDAFSSADHSSKFLFVWDCDFSTKVEVITETTNLKKFCFAINSSNTKAKNKKGEPSGIENLYSDDFFTDSVYNQKEITGAMGATGTMPEFDKQKFLDIIKQQTDNSAFTNFQPLIDKIKELLNPNN